jgi:hypothetical protein
MQLHKSVIGLAFSSEVGTGSREENASNEIRGDGDGETNQL